MGPQKREKEKKEKQFDQNERNGFGSRLLSRPLTMQWCQQWF
jgi:hypothetical protein